MKAIKRKVGHVPKDLNEVEKMVVKIRELEGKIESIESKSNEEIRILEEQIVQKREQAKENSKLMREESERLSEVVYIFAESHRTELTDNLSKKTIELSTGDKLKWYIAPPSVKVENEKEALWELRRNELLKFIRTKETINKEAILEEPEGIQNIKSISISQDEIFSIVLCVQKIELKEPKKFRIEK